MSSFGELAGCTIVSVDGCERGSERITFTLDDGRQCRLFHMQDCCECVQVEDVVGDINNLIRSPVLMANELSPNDGQKLNECDDSFTWTFYDIATKKGAVTIRWYGSSNGYYSESVDFDWLPNCYQGDG